MSLEIAIIGASVGLSFVFAFLASQTDEDALQLMFTMISLYTAYSSTFMASSLSVSSYPSIANIFDSLGIIFIIGILTTLLYSIIAFIVNIFDITIGKKKNGR